MDDRKRAIDAAMVDVLRRCKGWRGDEPLEDVEHHGEPGALRALALAIETTPAAGPPQGHAERIAALRKLVSAYAALAEPWTPPPPPPGG